MGAVIVIVGHCSHQRSTLRAVAHRHGACVLSVCGVFVSWGFLVPGDHAGEVGDVVRVGGL